MNKTIKITVPEELTIIQYERLGKLDHLRQIEKMVRIISAISGYDEEEIKSWDIKSINRIYTELSDAISNIQPIFLPIFEFKGIKYGMQPISKMSGGEYISLEKTLENKDMLGAMAILYRPITKNKLDTLEWHTKSYLKYVRGQAENLFKYYSVEEYDLETVEWRKDIFEDLPVSVAMGAYNFFLLVGLQLSNYTLQSSKDLKETDKKMMNQVMEKVLANIGAGFLPSINSQKTEESSD